MTVLRVDHQKDYVVINKTLLEDPTLSFKAKGLWAYCMSRPNHWEFHVCHLATVSKDGEDAIYSALNELQNAGYLRKIQKNEKGRFGSVDYEISEIKIILPLRDFPDAAFPRTENPALVSNDNKKIKISSNPPLPPPKTELSKVIYNPTKEEEEEVERRFKKRERERGRVDVPLNWKKKALTNLREEMLSFPSMDKKLIKSRKEFVKQYDRKELNGINIIPCTEYVEFCKGSWTKLLRYDSTQEDWDNEWEKINSLGKST